MRRARWPDTWPYSDFPVEITLPTYTLEEILTEKLCALMGRTEPRDLYDVYWILEWGDADLSFLSADLAAKCEHKGQDVGQFDRILSTKEATMQRLWESRLAVQVPDLPHLNEILRAVRRHLRGLDLIQGNPR
ncbi:MAG: nucleotidyl transferase AbiEii/AbiGii toxin family protein [Anaerolineae bacterium]